jgi:hypothetical protein
MACLTKLIRMLGQHACAHALLSDDDRQRFLAMLLLRAGSSRVGEGMAWNKRL